MKLCPRCHGDLIRRRSGKVCRFCYLPPTYCTCLDKAQKTLEEPLPDLDGTADVEPATF